MTPDELLSAVERLRSGSLRTQEERDQLILAIDRAVPHAKISDMIYYPDKRRSSEEIVAEALRRERISTTN